MNRTKTAVLLLVALMVAFSGCVQPPEPPKELPEDLEIEYGNGAMHAEWGQYNLKIDNKGNAVFEKTIETDLGKKYEFVVSETERKKIYDAVVMNNFFSLNDKYEDPIIMDGGWSEISIKANGERKTVTLQNAHQEQFEKVENEINQLIILKIGEEAFSFTDLMNE